MVHMPFSVGFVCGPSVGTPPPFAIFGVQVCTLSSHQLPPEQSVSTLQLPAASQVPFELHAPERQTTPPFATVQGPSPFA